MTTTIVTLDKSRFDKYFLFQISDDIDDIFKSWIDFDHGYMPTTEYHQTHENWSTHKSDRLRRLFHWLRFSFKNCPTVIYDGRAYRRQFAGMPSGVYVTQLYDTFYFGITNAATLFTMGFHESDIILYKGEGDDIIFQLGLFIPPNEHSSFLELYAYTDNQMFGSITKPESCAVTHSPNGTTVLGYTNVNGLPHRSKVDLLAQLYHTKAVNPTPSKTMAIAVGIAYASMGIYDDQTHDVYNVCKDIFLYYQKQGYSPDEQAFQNTLYLDVIAGTDIDYQHFPSIPEIQKNLLNFDYSAPATMHRFYNRDWFQSDF